MSNTVEKGNIIQFQNTKGIVTTKRKCGYLDVILTEGGVYNMKVMGNCKVNSKLYNYEIKEIYKDYIIVKLIMSL